MVMTILKKLSGTIVVFSTELVLLWCIQKESTKFINSVVGIISLYVLSSFIKVFSAFVAVYSTL